MPYNCKLLIVEDCKDDIDRVLYRTTQFHFNYEIAGTLTEAYVAADRFKPQMMFVDVGLPFDAAGVASRTYAEFERILEFIHKYANLSVVIMLTGDLNPTHLKMAIAAGAAEWIPKNKVLDSPEEFRQQIIEAYNNHQPEGPLPNATGELTPSQEREMILRAVRSMRKDFIIFRTSTELAVIAAAKLAKEQTGKIKEDAVALARKEGILVGEKKALAKARSEYRAKIGSIFAGSILLAYGTGTYLGKFIAFAVEHLSFKR